MDDSLPPDIELQRALGIAHRSLARRDRTEAEVRALLARRRVEPGVIELALGELGEAGLVDDEQFARRFADDKRELERWGSRRIAQDLERRGVAPGHVAAVVGGRDRRAELESAVLLLERRAPAPPADDRDRDRAWRLLVRRGYEPELAYEAVREHERRAASRPRV
jgi:regulatory protein